MKNEFYDIAFRKKIYHSLEEFQVAPLSSGTIGSTNITNTDHTLGNTVMEKHPCRLSERQSIWQQRKLSTPPKYRTAQLI
jgi:hypothetical protein